MCYEQHFSVGKVGSSFTTTKNPNIHGGMIAALTFSVVIYSRASMDATWVALE